MHVKINRFLATIALVLGIVLMAAVVVFGIGFVSKMSELSRPVSGDVQEQPYEAPAVPDLEAPATDAGCDYEGGPACEPTN